MSLIHEIVSIPEVRALWTGSPLDLLGISFALLIAYVLICGTASTIVFQLRAVTTAIVNRRSAPLHVTAYTASVISGFCPDLIRLKSVYAPAARVILIQRITKGLQPDSSPLARSLLLQFERRLRQEQRLVREVQCQPRQYSGNRSVYTSRNEGEA